jgi:hypothetical protein
MNGLVEHRHWQQRDGKWVAQFNLRICVGATEHSAQFFDSRKDLRYATAEEAENRNRSLVANWRDANMPDLELFESRN